MVAQFLGLKLRLLGNAYARRSWSLFAVIMVTLALVVITGLVSGRIATLRAADPQQLGWIVVLGGSVAVGLLAVIPFFAGRRDPFDPRRFGLYGIPPSRLALLLVVAGIVSVPMIVIGVLALATVLAWSSSVTLFFTGLVAAVLGFATCLLVSRITSALAAYLFAETRSRDFGGAFLVVVLVLVAALAVVLLGLDWQSQGPGVIIGLADGLGWTPLGAAWAIPAAAAAGEPGAAVAKAVIALVTVGVLWLAWRALVVRMLRSERRAQSVVERDALGWFARFPSSPAGAIAARSLTYWARDPRYFIALIPVPIIPFIMFLPLAIVNVPAEYLALIPLPVTCLFLGWAIHNDVAYDNTAIWLHIVSGRLGTADRIGRMIPSLVFGIPLIVVGSIVSAYFARDWSTVPAIIGVSTCLLFSGLGLGALTSARFPYPAVRPGDAPFEQPQSAGATPALVQTGSFIGVLALAAAPIGLAISAIGGDQNAYWAALWVGLAIGLVVIIAGAWLGGRLFDLRGPEILAQAERS